MTRPLLLIVGVQNSGTTLLSRLCQEQGVASNPFKTEGNDFFGNEPPFAPRGDPAGVIYQAHSGAHGHAIDAGADRPRPPGDQDRRDGARTGGQRLFAGQEVHPA